MELRTLYTKNNSTLAISSYLNSFHSYENFSLLGVILSNSQGLLLAWHSGIIPGVLGDQMECQGWNPGQLRARQVLLYYYSGPSIILFCFGATSSNSQDLLMALFSGMIPGGAEGPYGMPGIESR